jgi:hypothetical protein
VRAAGLSSALLVLVACQAREPGPASTAAEGSTQRAAGNSPLQQAERLFEGGQLDEALGLLDAGAGEADNLALVGAIWAKKAQSAPLPTPPPPEPGARRGSVPAAPEFKEEELTALGFLERALTAQAGHPRASLVLAQLLAPHALRRHDLREASSRNRKGRRAAAAEPDPVSSVDFSVDRVAQAFRAAAAGAGSGAALEALYAFAVRTDRIADAEWALEQSVQKDKENPVPLIRFGDFLAQEKKDPRAAIERYREALIWRPDDEQTLGKIADIYTSEAIELYNKSQYAVAQSRLLEAQKFVRNPNSPQGLRIKDYLSKIASIRQSPR